MNDNKEQPNNQKIANSFETLVSNGLYATTNNDEEKTKVLEKILSFIEIVESDTEFVNTKGKFGFDIYVALQTKISELQEIINKQLDVILHHEKFTALEGKWKGLNHLIQNVEHSTTLMVKVMCVSMDKLFKDLLKASDFDQGKFFKHFYENGIGTLGCFPFSCAILDHYFNASNHDVEILEKLLEIFASSHCPLISSVSPYVFNIDDFRKINQAKDISKVFQTVSRIAWNNLRMKPDAKYLTMVIPRVMARSPYSVDNNPAEGIRYNETVDSEKQENFVWMNAAYVLAVRILAAQVIYGWTMAIRGLESGGAAHDLPYFVYRKKEGDLGLKCPTEVSITDRRENNLSTKLGFATLCHYKGSNLAVFFSVPTIKANIEYAEEGANANAKISTSLPYSLIASRFIHCIKVMMRRLIGSFIDKKGLEDYFRTWISEYVLFNPSSSASSELKSRMPLKAAEVEVKEAPGEIGSYNVFLKLMPHSQLDSVDISVQLVAKFKKPAS